MLAYLFLFFVLELDHQLCFGAAMETHLSIKQISTINIKIDYRVTFFDFAGLCGTAAPPPAAFLIEQTNQSISAAKITKLFVCDFTCVCAIAAAKPENAALSKKKHKSLSNQRNQRNR